MHIYTHTYLHTLPTYKMHIHTYIIHRSTSLCVYVFICMYVCMYVCMHVCKLYRLIKIAFLCMITFCLIFTNRDSCVLGDNLSQLSF